MALQIRDLHVAIADRVLLRSASFQVPAHQLTVIVGASGSGKSTLLRIIAGLQKEQQDRSGVQWSGEIQWTESEADRRVGLVFQQPALLDELSGQENIQLAIDHGRKKRSIGFPILKGPGRRLPENGSIISMYRRRLAFQN